MVVGGDGMVNSIGSVLMGSSTALAVIPTGSGNGFARHFEVPLDTHEAAASLAQGRRLAIDVGTANGRPFFVTCSMAWDAAIVRSFEKSPIRGILPYVFAAVYEYFEYERQPFEATMDGGQRRTFKDPLLFTVANLTQYGGGLRIAPNACPDDGFLELIVVDRRDTPRVLAKLKKFFDGTVQSVPEVQSFKFTSLTVLRALPAPIQVDGELIDAPTEIKVELKPRALNVLVPRAKSDTAPENRPVEA